MIQARLGYHGTLLRVSCLFVPISPGKVQQTLGISRGCKSGEVKTVPGFNQALIHRPRLGGAGSRSPAVWKGALLSLGGPWLTGASEAPGWVWVCSLQSGDAHESPPPSPDGLAIMAPPPSRIAPPSPGLTVIEAPPPYCKNSHRRTWIPICARVPRSRGLSLRWLCCARNASLLRTSAQARPRPRFFGAREAESARRWRRRSYPSLSRYGAGARRGAVRTVVAAGRMRRRGSAAPGHRGGAR